MFYNNINFSHAKEKLIPLQKYYNLDKRDCIIVLGAQYREDILKLVNISEQEKIPIYLIDIRKSQLDKFKNSNLINKIRFDLSKGSRTYILFTSFKKLYNNPFIYDNLSGGSNRINHIKFILNFYKEICLFLNDRGGMLKKLYNQFKIINNYRISIHSYLSYIGGL